MEVYSDQPGVQFYTGNFMPEGQTLKGKTGYIQKHGAFCLETQIYPDAVNQVERNNISITLHINIIIFSRLPSPTLSSVQVKCTNTKPYTNLVSRTTNI